jgi:hypothetical protein
MQDLLNNKLSKSIFSFTPVANIVANKFAYDIDLRSYIPNTIGENVRVFSLYAWHSESDFGGSWIYSGAYIFYISSYAGLKFRKHTIHESGASATFDVLNYYTLRFSCVNNNSRSVQVVINSMAT